MMVPFVRIIFTDLCQRNAFLRVRKCSFSDNVWRYCTNCYALALRMFKVIDDRPLQKVISVVHLYFWSGRHAVSSVWSCSNLCSHYSLVWTSFSLFQWFRPLSIWSTTRRCVQWLLEISRRAMFPSDELTYLLGLAFSNDIFQLTRTWIIICVLQFCCGGGCWNDSRQRACLYS